jgi:hypothetical protein
MRYREREEVRMTRLLRFALGVPLAILLGCSDGEPVSPPPVQDVAGFWAGTITFAQPSPTAIGTGVGDTGRLEQVELALTQDAAGQIRGVGALMPRQMGTVAFGGRTAPAVQARAVEVQGTNAFPIVVMMLRAGTELMTAEQVYLTGEFVGVDRLSARLLGGGFNNDRIELRRTDTMRR